MNSRPADAAPACSVDAAVDSMLLSALDVESSLYHLGQYCGSWAASTGGHDRGSFHLVLRGGCWLHLPRAGGRAVALNAGDGVFFLRDVPHRLGPHPDPAAMPPGLAGEMTPLEPPQPDGTALACGFFRLRAGMGVILSETLPDHLVLRADDPRFASARALFGLILEESARPPQPSTVLLERLTNLLVFYVLRHLADEGPQAGGLLALARDPALAALLQAVMAEPGRPWTLQDMARRTHMSAATLHRRFTRLGAVTPAQLLQQLRMRAAARLLAQGWRIAETAEHVGYQSQAAFSRLFQRTLGHTPSAWRRMMASPAGTQQPYVSEEETW